MNKTLFIADYFVEQILGGGELNNDVLISSLRSQGIVVDCKNSHQVKESDIIKYDNFIVANFVNLQETIKVLLQDRKYVIYEHDHKYLKSRNPSNYKNYIAPDDHIINRDFYKNATAILCQSSFHANIVRKNLKLSNIISLGGNLWTEEQFKLLEQMSTVEKKEKHAIMKSFTKHKGTREAQQYCNSLGLQHVLIPPQPANDFIKDLGQYKTLVFFPQTPETLSRIVVEARMMGMSTKTTNNVGAIHEDWFEKKGLDLINYLRYNKKKEIINTILETLYE